VRARGAVRRPALTLALATLLLATLSRRTRANDPSPIDHECERECAGTPLCEPPAVSNCYELCVASKQGKQPEGCSYSGRALLFALFAFVALCVTPIASRANEPVDDLECASECQTWRDPPPPEANRCYETCVASKDQGHGCSIGAP
jgi:hypothetical protein